MNAGTPEIMMTGPDNPASPDALILRPRSPRVEPEMALPTRKLLATTLIAPAAVAGGWWTTSLLQGVAVDFVWAGVLGAAVVAVTSSLGVVVVGPWKRRPIGLWAALWMGGAVLRLLLTPLLAFVLYSATRFSVLAVSLSVAIAYMVTLLAEAIVLSRHTKRLLST